MKSVGFKSSNDSSNAIFDQMSKNSMRLSYRKALLNETDKPCSSPIEGTLLPLIEPDGAN
ncbi:hypothetical protein CZ794_01885 [Psychrobacter sp. JB385]|nr:hypothetical protein CZ794_01885 [Psychrobacter sp. JB385]